MSSLKIQSQKPHKNVPLKLYYRISPVTHEQPPLQSARPSGYLEYIMERLNSAVIYQSQIVCNSVCYHLQFMLRSFSPSLLRAQQEF